MSTQPPARPAFELKSTAWTLASLRLHTIDLSAVAELLHRRYGRTPTLFEDDAVVVDLTSLRDATEAIDFQALDVALRRHRLRLVAAQGGNDAQMAAALAAGLVEAMDAAPDTPATVSAAATPVELVREVEVVREVVRGGPAGLSGKLKAGDRIIGIGQGSKGEMVDVIGWRLDEVVELIRGKKETLVQLEVVPANAKDSTSKLVQIVRNTVKLEEQSAKSEILEVEQFGHKHKIGVIDIPTFYIDFQALQEGNRDFKSTTRDVNNLLVELLAEGVEGIIIDLRDNGGGSLQEARTLTGLFIDRGPTVQVRNNTDRVDILNDRDIRTVYDGPLAVVVNRLSASASEIFAGAIQDYDRGVIIGNQTFGKGTVQTLLPLNQGQLKLTAAKFYRISGEIKKAGELGFFRLFLFLVN